MHREPDHAASVPAGTDRWHDPKLGQIAFWLTCVSVVAYAALNQGLPNHLTFVMEAAKKVVAAVSK